MRNKSRAKQRTTFSEQGRVEDLMFGGSWPVEECWTDLAEATTLTERRILLAVEKVMFPAALVLRRAKITMMMILCVNPISGY